MTDNFSRFVGIGLIGILVLYTILQYWQASRNKVDIGEIEDGNFKNMKMALLCLLGGLVLIAVGAEFLVNGAKTSARILGVPEDIVALSIVALGTSLPELSTCLIAARKKETDLILGNIIGSNVFNILMILGITVMVKPIAMQDIAPQLLSFDIWFVLAISLLFTVILFTYKKIDKIVGGIFFAGYFAYIIYIYIANMPQLL